MPPTPAFGRRQPAAIQAFRPPHQSNPLEPAPSKSPARRSSVDPEFTAWERARARTRWKTWGTCGLLLLGGPMSFLLPEGIGQWAGFGLMALGGASLLARFRKPQPEAPSAATEDF